MARSFDSGTLIWIDDDFAFDDFDRPLGEIDMWNRTFGRADSRIYRLMNLSLEIATSKSEAVAMIDDLVKGHGHSRFIQAVVDMRIPGRPGHKPEMMHGISVAQHLKKHGIPFCFLSSSSAAPRELARHRLDRVPFEKKIGAPSPTMMPDSLVRHLLAEFRNSVTWLDLGPIFETFDQSSRHPLIGAEKLLSYFPFFAGYRDFVERWEARSGRVRSGTIVLRSPKDHSDAFVTLCAAVVISGQQSRLAPKVNYISGGDAQTLDMLLSAGILTDPTVHLVVRFLGVDAASDRLQLRRLLREPARCQIYVVMPEDESADELLQELASHRDIIYDDLPRTRFHDRAAREQLIRACSRLVFQKLRLQTDEGVTAPLHDVFLQHPEILVNPAHWSFLLDSDDVDDDISDVTEVIAAFSATATVLESEGSGVVERLVSGRSIPLASLSRPAEAVFQRHKEKQGVWVERALHSWLSRSWQSPFGVVIPGVDRRDSDAAAEWEEHCLSVALALAREVQTISGALKSSDVTSQALASAAKFLTHDVVAKMLSATVLPQDWLRLESERWPHQHFPMPAALHRRLRINGRYLWVQTDFLDRASIILSGREALRRVEARAERHGRRMDWLSSAIPTLPQGWLQSAALIHSILDARSIEQAWASDRDRDALWDAIYAIVRNATPVSLMFYGLSQSQAPQSLEALHTDLTKIRGAGALLGKVRGKREKLIPELFKIVEPQHHDWRSNLSYVQDFFQAAEVFRAFPLHKSYISGISTAADRFSREIVRLGDIQSSQDGGDVEALVNGILKMLYAHQVGLQSGIFHNDFPPPVDAHSPLHYGALRGLTVDALMALLEAGEKLRATLSPIVHFDGYHFLCLAQDLRNLEKGLSPKDLNPRVLHKLFELFLMGFEGLVAQLKGCLEFAGRHDLASAIPIGTVALVGQRTSESKCDAQLKNMLRVTGVPGNYSVFTIGIPGGRAVNRLAYDLPGSGLIYVDPDTALAAE